MESMIRPTTPHPPDWSKFSRFSPQPVCRNPTSELPTVRELSTISAFHRTEPQLSRLGGLFYLLQSLRQQFLFPEVLRQCNSALDFLTRLRELSHLHEQVSANTVKQMIASQRRVSGVRSDGIECIKPGGWALRHTYGYCSIQCHDGRWRGLHQSVVEKNN